MEILFHFLPDKLVETFKEQQFSFQQGAGRINDLAKGELTT